MDSEDNVSYSSNNLNGSFGRDVLSAGRPKKIEYLDSSTASSGNEGVDMDDYLDEALEEDDDSSDYHDNGKPAVSLNLIHFIFSSESFGLQAFSCECKKKRK